jgi:hypothetical protein
MSAGARVGWRWKQKAARAADRKAIVLVHPSKGSGGPEHAGNSSAQSPAINSIGAHMQDRVTAAIAREAAKNAVGASTANVGGGAANNVGATSATTGVRLVTNAIGVAVPFHPRPPGAVTVVPLVGVTAVAGNATRTVAVSNGAGMTRIGSLPGAIGGPARQLASGLNGTSFRPRHP